MFENILGHPVFVSCFLFTVKIFTSKYHCTTRTNTISQDHRNEINRQIVYSTLTHSSHIFLEAQIIPSDNNVKITKISFLCAINTDACKNRDE